MKLGNSWKYSTTLATAQRLDADLVTAFTALDAQYHG
jgi:hypothetical protein